MAVWRRRALALFPDLRRDIEDPDLTVGQLFFDLLWRARLAHGKKDRDALRKIYGFADWCASQATEDLWNSAYVCFYEHLFDEWSLREKVVPWLSPERIADAWELWEWRLSPDEMSELQRLFATRSERLYRCLDRGDRPG